MISGIGPRKTLEGLRIQVLADLKGVGQNMWVCFVFSSLPKHLIEAHDIAGSHRIQSSICSGFDHS